MRLEYGLVENALDSLRESMAYYTEGDETHNVNQYKFSILLAAHCAELLLKEILRRNHPALLFENIDVVNSLEDDDNQTVGYRVAIQRVKRLCKIDLRHYENNLVELGRVRNQIQHYKCVINGAYHKELMARAFSSIEFLFREILGLRFEAYENIIDRADIEFLHEDAVANETRKADIAREFKRDQNKFEIEYINKKYIAVCCPNCATESLSISDGKIICKFCGADFENYSALHAADRNCITQEAILREFGRRKHLLRSRVFACPECENNSVIHLPDGTWMCLVCGSRIEETMYCDECGDEIPNSNRIYKTAISDTNADDFRFLCPDCAKRYTEEEQLMGYALE